jgi:phospholipid transport system substrate-binding protein
VGPLADARAAMDVTITEVLDVLKAPDLTSEARRQQIETIARERFDFETMSKLVLKRDWKRFSKEQRADFVREFTNYLAKNYGSRIDRYDQQSVEMLKDRLEANGDVTVLTEIRGGEADGIEVSYRMRDRNEAWRVIDVVIEGVSLISSFRSQFADVLSAGGPDEVLRRLTERNAQPAPAEESAPTA